MTEVSYTQARDSLAKLLDTVESDRDPIMIQRRGHEAIALIPSAELKSLMETAHLLRSPANARKLLAALDRAQEGKFTPITTTQLRQKVGLHGSGG